MDRLLVVRCPELLEEDEGGAVLRAFAAVVARIETLCPWVTTVRPGICSLPARGPARYFGGETALADLVRVTASAVTPAEVGVADGLFAAVLAAGRDLVVPAGGTPEFLAPLPVLSLGQPDLAELLGRLGIHTLGEFAALPEAHVLGRFGADGALGHRVAGGRTGEAAGLRTARCDPRRTAGGNRVAPEGTEPGFWGGVSDTDARAARCLEAVQDLLGPEGVVTAHLQGGRGPVERARFVTWNARAEQKSRDGGAPWPGRIPPPAPAVVHPAPLRADLADASGSPVRVSGRGLLTSPPDRLSVEEGPWAALSGWAGPWPSDERWWSRSRRRGARLQAVTAGYAHLLLLEQGRWWVEATYG